jgi:hypothetical protein
METIAVIPTVNPPTYCGPPPRFQLIEGQCVEYATPSCAPGFVNNPANPFQCVPQSCTLVISYSTIAPHQVQLAPLPAHCDAAGAELALAVIVARLLGAP